MGTGPAAQAIRDIFHNSRYWVWKLEPTVKVSCGKRVAHCRGVGESASYSVNGSGLPTFEEFFHKATGKRPYPYQVALADRPFSNCVVSVPTGCGKTAAVLLWWLYQTQQAPVETPRRLAYCLPTRALVEQTARAARQWIDGLSASATVPVYLLQGGEIEEEWELWPEQRTLIIGTQDLMLSRALNRGYAMNPARWPVSFGLLNNDCVWVLDETQLMSSGLFTTVQLQSMRQTLGAHGRAVSVWMSATMEDTKLRTVDFRSHVESLPRISLKANDLKHPELALRLAARKELVWSKNS